MNNFKTRKNSGYIMVLALVVATIIMIYLLMVTGRIFVQRRQVDHSYHRERALALAESGIDTSVACLNEKNLSKPYPAISGTIPGMGNFLVRITSSGSTINLNSTGYSKSNGEILAQRSVEVSCKKPVFDYAVATRGGINVEDPDTTIEGDLYTVGDVNIEGATVNGDVSATGSIITDATATLSGTASEGASEISFPEFDFAHYSDPAISHVIPDEGVPATGGVNLGSWDSSSDEFKIDNYTDDYSLPDFVGEDPLYVKGSVKITDSILEGPGIIIAEEKIKIESATIGKVTKIGTSTDAPVALVSALSGNEEAIIEAVSGASTEIHGLLWVPNAKVKIEKYSTLYGSVVSGGEHQIEVGSEIDFTETRFSTEFYSQFLNPEDYTFIITRWEEK